MYVMVNGSMQVTFLFISRCIKGSSVYPVCLPYFHSFTPWCFPSCTPFLTVCAHGSFDSRWGARDITGGDLLRGLFGSMLGTLLSSSGSRCTTRYISTNYVG